ncbi:MAG: glycosyl hydrolase [Planctomycetota bacterium]|nr:glycosyl hydrolase [Planctomycetota bacterium]
MKSSCRTRVIFGLVLLMQVGFGVSTLAADALAVGFKEPPKQARPSIYWLWLNGYVNRDHFEKELTAYKEKGVSGLCLFEMGARGPEGAIPEAGPPFFSEQFVDSVAHALEIAGRLDMDVQLATSSSWDMGGAWVEPHQASMRLYRSSMTLKGPLAFNGAIPMPHIAKDAPRGPDGKLSFVKNVAVLAVPANRRQPAHEFLFKLPRGDLHAINRVVLYNAKSDDPKKYGKPHLFTREFSVSVSATTRDSDQFSEILRTQLKPHVEPQQFRFAPTEVRYIRLRIYNGHNPDFDRVQLAEFEAYTVDGLNVAGSARVDRTRDCAELVWYNSELNDDGNWAAVNIHDGRTAYAHGSWSSAGPLPVTISDPSEIVDLTDKLSDDGVLDWTVPAGEWDILRFVCANTGERLKVPSPQSDGLATDHLSRQATRTYVEYLTSRLKAKLGDLSSTALKQLYLPSYEPEPEIWTPDFDVQFRKYKGYDITPFLPVLSGYIVKDEETTRRFLYDYRKALGELMIDAYYREASRAARDAGLGVEAEAGGPGTPLYQIPVDALKALGAIDEVRGEFWPWREQRDVIWVVKETACAAHINKRL